MPPLPLFQSSMGKHFGTAKGFVLLAETFLEHP